MPTHGLSARRITKHSLTRLSPSVCPLNCEADCGQRGEAAGALAKAATSMALRQAQAVRQPARFLQLLNEAGFLVRRNRPTVQTGIRTPRRTTRSEYRTLTDAQTILVQR